MKEIYAVLLSSALGVGCGSATTETKTPEQVKTDSLADLATETYQRVSELPDKTFPLFPLPKGAVDYGQFGWKVLAYKDALVYMTQHKSLPVIIGIMDHYHDGTVDSTTRCLFHTNYTNSGLVRDFKCIEADLPTASGIVPLTKPAQVMYEKLLKDTPPAMDGKKVTADEEFSAAYFTFFPENTRRLLQETE